VVKKTNKKRQNKSNQHPEMSFEQRMTQAVGKAQKSLIANEVSQQLNQMLPHIQRLGLEGQKNLLTRIAVLEDLVLESTKDLTPEILADKVIAKEDELLGYVVSGDPAAAGDTIRLDLSHKREGSDEFSEPQASMIKSLTRVANPTSGATQLFPEVEEAIVGALPGADIVVEVDVDEPEFNDAGEKVKDAKVKYEIKVKVTKVMTSAGELAQRAAKEAAENQTEGES